MLRVPLECTETELNFATFLSYCSLPVAFLHYIATGWPRPFHTLGFLATGTAILSLTLTLTLKLTLSLIYRTLPVSLKIQLTHRPCHRPSDAFGKRRPVGRCGGGSVESDTCELQGRVWLRVGRVMSIVVYNCVIIVGEDDGSA